MLSVYWSTICLYIHCSILHPPLKESLHMQLISSALAKLLCVMFLALYDIKSMTNISLNPTQVITDVTSQENQATACWIVSNNSAATKNFSTWSCSISIVMIMDTVIYFSLESNVSTLFYNQCRHIVISLQLKLQESFSFPETSDNYNE